MYNELYPAPQVNWYPGAQASSRPNNTGFAYPENAGCHNGPSGAKPGSFANVSFNNVGAEPYSKNEYGRSSNEMQCMSFYTRAAAQAFPRGGTWNAKELHTTTQANNGNDGNRGNSGFLVVNVDSALDLSPSDRFGPHFYYANAHYPGESEDEIEMRKTSPVKANPSSTNPVKENCVLHKRITVPYNSRQQLLMVSIFEADQLGDTFIGKATVPLADPKLGSTSPWQLIRDSYPNGTLTLNIQLPNTDGLGASKSAASRDPGTANPLTVSSSSVTPYGPDSPRRNPHGDAHAAGFIDPPAEMRPIRDLGASTQGLYQQPPGPGPAYGPPPPFASARPSSYTPPPACISAGNASSHSYTPPPVAGLPGLPPVSLPPLAPLQLPHSTAPGLFNVPMTQSQHPQFSSIPASYAPPSHPMMQQSVLAPVNATQAHPQQSGYRPAQMQSSGLPYQVSRVPSGMMVGTQARPPGFPATSYKPMQNAAPKYY